MKESHNWGLPNKDTVLIHLPPRLIQGLQDLPRQETPTQQKRSYCEARPEQTTATCIFKAANPSGKKKMKEKVGNKYI